VILTSFRLKNKMDRAQETPQIVLGRHRPLTHDAWSELAVRAAIEEILTDAIAHFDPDGFWPSHPSDDGVGDGNRSFYWGAAGVIWALDYLHRVGGASFPDDRRVLTRTQLRPIFPEQRPNSPASCGRSRHAPV
jgi:hypothetical protein